MIGTRGLLLGGLVTVLGLAVAIHVWPTAPPPATFPPPLFPPASDQPITPIPGALDLDPRLVALGRRLFHDKRLSRDDTVACASCHDLELAGGDARETAMGVDGQMGTLNSPTVFNSAFSFRQFWDGRAATLEEQAEGPVHNPIEMATDWAQVMAKLRGDAGYVAEFSALWPDGIQPAHIQRAIAEFERSLITPDSPFDRYLRGDANALAADALRGWDLFRNLGCVACHQGVNMGGNMYATLGVMGDYFAERGGALQKSDLGRFNVTGREEDRHVFKVPTLRNVARTAPYFHDGSIATLDEAVDVMARNQLGVRLAEEERWALVAFLRAQNGRLPLIAP
ncbi:MAG: cytochrome-c peroxidase [Pseudomonadota bacterium]